MGLRKTMRIAFVSTIFEYPWGGADTLWTHAAEAADARGDDLLVAVSRAVAESPRIASLHATRVIRERPEVPRSLPRRIARKIRGLLFADDPALGALGRFRPDLIVVSLGGAYDLASSESWTAGLTEAGAPFRLIANFQVESPSLSTPEMERARILFQGAERVFFVSSRNLEVTRRHLGLPLGNACVVQNPLRWRPSDRSPWPEPGFLAFAAVARLEPVKGIGLLLEAIARALGGESMWRLRIYGRGPDEADLRRRAGELGIGERVDFCGFVAELGKIWAENHMLVSPAADEGVPMTIPEAMLCGRPVLATAVGGASDWIMPDSSGFLCPPASVDELAGALRRAWASRARWREMGERASSDASGRYRPEDYLQVVGPLTGLQP